MADCSMGAGHLAGHQHGQRCQHKTGAANHPAEHRHAGTTVLTVLTGMPLCHLETSLIHRCGSEGATGALLNRSVPVAPWLAGRSGSQIYRCGPDAFDGPEQGGSTSSRARLKQLVCPRRV